MVDLHEGKGHEQKGPRPGIIIGSANGLVTMVPLTSQITRAAFSHTEVIAPTKGTGLRTESVALVFQMKSMDRTRLKRKLGSISEEDMRRIDGQISDLLGLDR